MPVETLATFEEPIASLVARFEEDLLTLERITRKLGLLRAFPPFKHVTTCARVPKALQPSETANSPLYHFYNCILM